MNMDRAFNEHELNQALEHLRATMYLINRLTLSKHQFELSEMTKNELMNRYFILFCKINKFIVNYYLQNLQIENYESIRCKNRPKNQVF